MIVYILAVLLITIITFFNSPTQTYARIQSNIIIILGIYLATFCRTETYKLIIIVMEICDMIIPFGQLPFQWRSQRGGRGTDCPPPPTTKMGTEPQKMGTRRRERRETGRGRREKGREGEKKAEGKEGKGERRERGRRAGELFHSIVFD